MLYLCMLKLLKCNFYNKNYKSFNKQTTNKQ